MALLIGLDQGYTKTALAVADAAGQIVFSSALSCDYGQLAGKEDKASRAARYRQRVADLLTQAAPHVHGHSAHLVYAGNIAPDEPMLREVFSAAQCELDKIEPCGDALGHYGLSSMPARAFVIGAGSGSIVAYIDKDHNFITPPEPHWEIANFGNLLSAGGLSNALLDIYAREQLSCQPGAISAAVEAQLGKRAANHSIYHYLYKFRVKIGRGRRLELTRQIPVLLHEQAVAALIDRAVEDAVNYLKLLMDYMQDPAPQALILGGSVALGIPGLAERFMIAWPGLKVELAQGNPAEGVVRYRLAYPQARCDAGFGNAFFSNWKRA